MNIILLEKIENLGDIGDQVKVKAGYGRNYLVPKGKATMATPANIEKFEGMRAQFEARAADSLAAATGRAERLQGMDISIAAKAGTEGKLFGSVGNTDIADACKRAGVEIDRSEVRMVDGPLRHVGEHEVGVHLHTDVDVILKVNVVAEE